MAERNLGTKVEKEYSIDDLKLRGNSHASKVKEGEEGEHKRKPVIKSGDLVSVKKPLHQKFAEMFISSDVKDIKSYIFLDVVIPTIKNTILDAIEMLFFNTGGRRSRRPSYGEPTSYSTYYKSDAISRRGRGRDSRRDDRYQREGRVDYRNIILRDRFAADAVVDSLRRSISEYGQATIMDLYDAIDVDSNFTDSNWGWTNVNDIGVKRVSQGYLIDVAEAVYLD